MRRRPLFWNDDVIDEKGNVHELLPKRKTYSLNLVSSNFTGTIAAFKTGDVVEIYGYIRSVSDLSGVSNVVVNMPAELTPIASFVFSKLTSGNSPYLGVQDNSCLIRSSRDIVMTGNISAETPFYINCTYIVKEVN